ncbi:MAG: hypothetical protein ACLQBB_02470 [Solirubrobacteraceae bacterium]
MAACAAAGPPHALFPSDAPARGTGPGALVWAAGAGCPGGAGARVDPIGAGEVPLAPMLPRSGAGAPLDPQGTLAAAAGPHGQIAIAGADPQDPGETLLIQGQAGGPFAPLSGSAAIAPPGALGTAYLGDLAFAATSARTGGVLVAIERFFSRALGPAVEAGGPDDAPVTGLTVALDYRTDALVAWAQSGSIYVRDLPASGARRRLQRLGPAGSHPRIAALLSDDDRGIVMWSEQRGPVSDVYVDYSAAGVRFGAPRLLESARDPAGPATPYGSPLLIRLSSESVMAAWAGVAAGRWVVRSAPIDQHGLRAVGTIQGPGGGDALPQALAPGPRGEAVLLFSEAQPGPDAGQALLAVRGVDTYPGRTVFGAPALLSPAGQLGAATVAVDPVTDRAVAAWQGPGGSILYSISGTETGDSGGGPPP